MIYPCSSVKICGFFFDLIYEQTKNNFFALYELGETAISGEI